MKIDKDLRAAINAAAKAQPDRPWGYDGEIIQQAVNAFIKKRPLVQRHANHLIEAIKAVDKKKNDLEAKLAAILSPLGLRYYEKQIKAAFRRDDEGGAKLKFTKAGGVLPPPNKRKWSAHEAIAELAAAEPKQLKRILKKYGINWT